MDLKKYFWLVLIMFLVHCQGLPCLRTGKSPVPEGAVDGAATVTDRPEQL
jgi:hypothetical protein